MAQMFPRPTKTYRGSPYEEISPLRPELSLKGQTVLITGGATGIGLETTKAFAAAGAKTIILVARSQERMINAQKSIEHDYPHTKIVSHSISITDHDAINKLVQDIGTIDVLILNAGALHNPKPVLELDTKEIANAFAVNVLGPLNLIQAFVKLPARTKDARRTVIYTSAWAINMVMLGASGYGASKSAMTYIMRCIHEENTDENLRTFAFHPAVAYTAMPKDVLGWPEDAVEWDTSKSCYVESLTWGYASACSSIIVDLPAHYAVWLCSPEADYLKGRFVSANWDVKELEAKKGKILKDPSLLKMVTNLEGLAE